MPRHHVIPGWSVFFFARLILLIGCPLGIGGIHGGNLYCKKMPASIVPGAIAFGLFILALPVFLCLLQVPTLEWLFAPNEQGQRVLGENRDSEISEYRIPSSLQLGVLVLVLALNRQ